MSAGPKVLLVTRRGEPRAPRPSGAEIAAALQASHRHDFVLAECDGPGEYRAAVRRAAPVAVIHDLDPAATPWLTRRLLRELDVPHLGVLRDASQASADAATDRLFDGHVADDPTLLLRNPLVFKTGRLVPRAGPPPAPPAVTTIGSVGAGRGADGFEQLVDAVQDHFDEAVIRLHVCPEEPRDADPSLAGALVARLRPRLRTPGVELHVTAGALSRDALVRFLAGNSLNAFLYEDAAGPGVAAVTDLALAAGRPLAIARRAPFRHLAALRPSICVEDAPIPVILERGGEAIRRLAEEWCPENLAWDYERIVDAALARGPRSPARRLEALARRVVRAVRRRAAGDWSPGLAAAAPADVVPEGAPPYDPSAVRPAGFNRILDAAASEAYRPAIEYMARHFPRLVARKIARANVQQAFVLDTVARLAPPRDRARLLCVGSYEDTASAALVLGGFRVDEIDPVLNYDLGTYLTRPTCPRGGYDVVFSTSVIEHVADDARFVRDVGACLAPGGLAVITADFDDAWRPGAPLPREDHRLYTARDFEERLLPLLPDCRLIDEPRWRGVPPDFEYGGCRYSFATLVFRRSR